MRTKKRQQFVEKLHAAIYAEWLKLTKEDGKSATEATHDLMDKFHIFAPSTIYNIRKRMEAKEAEIAKGGKS